MRSCCRLNTFAISIYNTQTFIIPMPGKLSGFKNLPKQGKVKTYAHIQANVPFEHVEEYDDFGNWLRENGLIQANNVNLVTAAALEMCRISFRKHIAENIKIRPPDGWEMTPAKRRNRVSKLMARKLKNASP